MGSESANLVSVAKVETGETGFIGYIMENLTFSGGNCVKPSVSGEGPAIDQILEFGNFPVVVQLTNNYQ